MNARWIVGVDGSIESRAALTWALHQGERIGADLTVVYASHDSTATADVALDAMVGDLGDDLHIERLVVGRSPGRALVVAGADADAIVVGRRGSGGGWGFGLGSTSRYCVTHASVPTVVVPIGWDGRDVQQVVIGFDGSEHSAAALRWAIDFAPADAAITAVLAIEIAPWLAPEIVEERLADEVTAERLRLLEAIQSVDPDAAAERRVVVRGARPALDDACEHADVVVLGRRGAGALSSLIVGSVSTWMLDAASVPVVVVPTPSAG